MQLVVRINDDILRALGDSGSMHSFISASAASILHLEPDACPGLHMTVANGDHAVHIFIDSEEFIIDLFVIPLEGYDMMLGVQWLRTLGPILWDFERTRMSCWCDNHRVMWQGTSGRRTAAVHTMEASDLMLVLLQEFKAVFATPSGLPPPRCHSHRIHLLPDTPSVAVRPYRYLQLVKDELERQSHDMLQQGHTRTSSSTFSSTLLVKKHDGSWRFCVDYRTLNSKTVRDKFPIPVVDELNELRGARFFTKLDLRSGYHQVRMRADDIEKMTFRTHHGHFVFMVMLFGLTNAPATFQAMTNNVLQDFIHLFILVFFDDILIYSNSWSSHLQHARAVLQRLRKHSLFVKHTKCSFDAEEVAYLEHVISARGVAMDNDKVAVVQA
jgi:hypothetical protein